MKIYLASSSANIDTVENWRDALKAYGHEITIDWPAMVRRFGANPTHATVAERRIWADADLDAVGNSDYFWMLMPGSFGSGVEYGAATIHGVPRIVSGDWRSSIFTCYASCFDTHEDAFKHIIESGLRIVK